MNQNRRTITCTTMNKIIISLLIISQMVVINQDDSRNYDVKINNTMNDRIKGNDGSYYIGNNDKSMRRRKNKSHKPHRRRKQNHQTDKSQRYTYEAKITFPGTNSHANEQIELPICGNSNANKSDDTWTITSERNQKNHIHHGEDTEGVDKPTRIVEPKERDAEPPDRGKSKTDITKLQSRIIPVMNYPWEDNSNAVGERSHNLHG